MNTIKSSSDRWQYIDLLEFLGMLLVIMCHSPTYSFAWMEEGA
jgi:fucose 4-O-acetylase-like acetyltransferase